MMPNPFFEIISNLLASVLTFPHWQIHGKKLEGKCTKMLFFCHLAEETWLVEEGWRKEGKGRGGWGMKPPQRKFHQTSFQWSKQRWNLYCSFVFLEAEIIRHFFVTFFWHSKSLPPASLYSVSSINCFPHFLHLTLQLVFFYTSKPKMFSVF